MKECDSEQYLDTIQVSWWITAFWLFPPILCTATYWLSLEVYVIMVSSVFLLTLLVVSISYVVIMRVMWKAKRILSTNNYCRKTHDRFKIGRKVAILITCYILCFLPISLMLSTNLYYLATKRERPAGLQIFFMAADFLACVNSCINPWVYTLKIPRLKQQLRKRRRRKELMKKYAVVIYWTKWVTLNWRLAGGRLDPHRPPRPAWNSIPLKFIYSAISVQGSWRSSTLEGLLLRL